MTKAKNNAIVYDRAEVYENSIVCSDAKVCGYATIFGNAVIADKCDYIVFKKLVVKWKTLYMDKEQ